MHRQIANMIPLVFFFVFFSSLSTGLGVDLHGAAEEDSNPYTPKAYLIRYWNKQIRNNLPKPSFLLSKASPLSAVESATFAKLAADRAISTRLPQFCSSAHLLCFPDLGQSLQKNYTDADFNGYSFSENFTNYGNNRGGGLDAFKNYGAWPGFSATSFRGYTRGGAGHNDSFTTYASNANVVQQSFHTYGTGAVGGDGGFQNYDTFVNVPDLDFTTYSSDAAGRGQDFSSYSVLTNAGDQGFTNYGKSGHGLPTTFSSYGSQSNVIGSTFSSYDKTSTGANTTFKDYGVDQNVPENKFSSYGEGGVHGVVSFSNYRDRANVGDDSFISYVKNSKSAEANFANYGKTFNPGTDKFTHYSEGAKGQKVDFKEYGKNTTFKDYAKEGTTFSSYTNESSMKTSSMADSGSLAKRWVEPGKFFRESMLKEGTVMPMPDIRDKMPKRSFLPRSILSKLPFSSSKISELKQIFKIEDHSIMDKLVSDSLHECERAPSPGETKRCVGSIEDMIDFATSVLDRNIAVRTTQNVNGSKQNVMVGSVTGIHGGRITKSVSCHQSLFPYLLYYCHSVPKVRIYEADLLDPNTKAKINHGVAICHIDTSSWSAGHGAFLALGSGPGRIEVCHWIFENDLTWTTDD